MTTVNTDMNQELAYNEIRKAVTQTPFGNKTETVKAYIAGAKRMYEFLSLNPHLLEADEAERYFQMCLFPSRINH